MPGLQLSWRLGPAGRAKPASRVKSQQLDTIIFVQRGTSYRALTIQGTPAVLGPTRSYSGWPKTYWAGPWESWNNTALFESLHSESLHGRKLCEQNLNRFACQEAI